MSRLNLLLLGLFCTRIRYTKAAEKCLKTIDMRECSGSGPSLTSPPTCSNVTVCQDIFNISTIDIQPYSSVLMLPMIEMTVRSCCGTCRGMHFLSNFTSTKHFHDLLQTSAVTHSRFIFPILAEYNIDKVYGYHFVPLIDVQTGYYFVKKRKSSETVNALLKACLGLWPLFLITLLLAFIAGAIGWICVSVTFDMYNAFAALFTRRISTAKIQMDTRYNEEEFPRPFVKGVLEGFWWSFISMTTVGYGDKSPKSAQARAFAVIWIIMGITICSMFTAALTSAITESAKLPVVSMSGQKVAVLPDRLLDSTFVVDKGGTPIEVFSDINTIIEKVDSDDNLDGFFLDKHTRIGYETHPSRLYDEYYATDVTYSGEKLNYGMLVLRKIDFQYMTTFIKSNKLILQTCMGNASNGVKSQHEYEPGNVFSPSSGLFQPTIISCVSLMALIGGLGFIYEYRRRKRAKSKIDIPGKECEVEKVTHEVMIDDVQHMLKKWKSSPASDENNVENEKYKKTEEENSNNYELTAPMERQETL